MSTHDIKSHAGEAFEAVWEGDKRHEIRVNDRGYTKGDRVIMREWAPSTGDYSGRWVRVAVMHVTPGGAWGLPPELCVFSFHEVERSSSHASWACEGVFAQKMSMPTGTCHCGRPATVHPAAPIPVQGTAPAKETP